MTQPIVHCIFVSPARKETTAQLVTLQACGDIWHWNSPCYHPGPLDRKTTHQNNPLHLCLEVSVNSSNKRLPDVYITCVMVNERRVTQITQIRTRQMNGLFNEPGLLWEVKSSFLLPFICLTNYILAVSITNFNILTQTCRNIGQDGRVLGP